MSSELIRYDAACRAIAEARSVDEVKEIHDQAVAMKAYARQAKNRDLEADAIEIRLRATRRLDQMRQEQKATIGLASGGEHGGRKSKDGLRKNPSNVRPTLAGAGIDKNLAHEGRKLGALSDYDFEKVIADARDQVGRAVRKVVSDIFQEPPSDAPVRSVGTTTLILKTHTGEEVYYPQPQGKVTFNRTTEQVSWSKWTWNPVTGCLHNCPYCYAREMAETRESYRTTYPVGFTPRQRAPTCRHKNRPTPA
jgi:hypothetical protein